jgi:hypothetical protein
MSADFPLDRTRLTWLGQPYEDDKGSATIELTL